MKVRVLLQLVNPEGLVVSAKELLGLELEHGVEMVRPVIEGPLHNGDGAVVQVLARKPI